MMKMGGIICDKCRVVIAATHTDLWRDCTVPSKDGVKPILTDKILTCRAKKGNVMHFCSAECQEKQRGV